MRRGRILTTIVIILWLPFEPVNPCLNCLIAVEKCTEGGRGRGRQGTNVAQVVSASSARDIREDYLISRSYIGSTFRRDKWGSRFALRRVVSCDSNNEAEKSEEGWYRYKGEIART